MTTTQTTPLAALREAMEQERTYVLGADREAAALLAALEKLGWTVARVREPSEAQVERAARAYRGDRIFDAFPVRGQLQCLAAMRAALATLAEDHQ